MEERRQPFVVEEAKFSTQRIVTLMIFLIFAAVVINVLLHEDQSERSMILQTIINLTFMAAGYWLGASKGATDSNTTIRQLTTTQEPPKL